MRVNTNTPTTTTQPLSKIELRFECKNLVNLDLLSKTDCQIWVFMQNKSNQWNFIGKTEIVKNNLNPVFATPVQVDYYFEEVQNMRFVALDIDIPVNSMEGQDYVGEVLCTLGDIVGNRAQMLCRKLAHRLRHNSGHLIIKAEEIKDMKLDIHFKIGGTHLDKKDFLGKSDPYLEIAKQGNDGKWVIVKRTEWIKQTLNPNWKPFEMPLNTFGGLDNPLRWQVFDWDNDGKSDFIGEFICSLNETQTKKNWDLINQKKKKKNKKYVNSGTLNFQEVIFLQQYSFLEYITGGTEVNLMVAIDYTASNKDPTDPSSLHYINNQNLNQYGQVITTCGQILMAYDSDGNVPLYGFGARLPDGQTSHCFPVNFNNQNPNVFRVEGILQAYYQSFNTGLRLYGPTNMAPIISVAAQQARQLLNNNDVSSYLVLLIITDGEITDMPETVYQIVEASYLPMSIIIVGVGGADFSKMNFLDSDQGLLRSGNKSALRDIVQFVPFRDYSNDMNALAAHTLAELPKQFCDYMKMNRVVPRPPLTQQQVLTIQQQQMNMSVQ